MAESPPPDARDPHAAIVAELRARFGEEPAGPAVAIYLAARGYDPTQVAQVLARLSGADAPTVAAADRSAAAPASPEQSAAAVSAAAVSAAERAGRPLRAWAPHERARFTPEAWGRLLQLRAAGLGDSEFEHFVDRALLQLDGPVTLPELRALLGDALGPGAPDPPTLH